MTDARRAEPRADKDRVIIKKYANRRLYNTASSTYVTLDNLAEMVREGVDFVVYDAKTNDDITRAVLAQIIFDEESRGQNLLPIEFLRQLIRFYGDSMQSLLPTYLEMSMDAFTRQQERFRKQFSGSFGAAPGMQFFDDQVRQNLALFDRAMKMFSPFAFPEAGQAPGQAPGQTSGQAQPGGDAPAAPQPQTAGDPGIADLQRQLAEMQAQIAKLAAKG